MDPDYWRDHGVRIVPGSDLDVNTPQTPGMNRAAAITNARTGASKLWAGTVTIHPHAKTGVHHHGDLESVIYVVRGRARMRVGLQDRAISQGGVIFVAAEVEHRFYDITEELVVLVFFAPAET